MTHTPGIDDRDRIAPRIRLEARLQAQARGVYGLIAQIALALPRIKIGVGGGRAADDPMLDQLAVVVVIGFCDALLPTSQRLGDLGRLTTGADDLGDRSAGVLDPDGEVVGGVIGRAAHQRRRRSVDVAVGAHHDL